MNGQFLVPILTCRYFWTSPTSINNSFITFWTSLTYSLILPVPIAYECGQLCSRIYSTLLRQLSHLHLFWSFLIYSLYFRQKQIVQTSQQELFFFRSLRQMISGIQQHSLANLFLWWSKTTRSIIRKCYQSSKL